MMGVAKGLVDSGYQPEKTIIFNALAAEEWGVSNSRYDWSTGAYNQIFNIGSNESKTMIALKDTLIQIGKEKNILPKDYNPATQIGSKSFVVDVKLRVPSTEKIKKILGWESKVSFKECFEKFVEYKNSNLSK